VFSIGGWICAKNVNRAIPKQYYICIEIIPLSYVLKV